MKLDVKSALKRNGMSQADLAEAVDISRGFMSEIINGKKTPSLETLNKIMTTLGIKPSDIYEYDAQSPLYSEQPETTTKGGFGEAQAAPFTPRRNSMSAKLLKTLYPKGGHLATYKVSGSSMGFMIADDDVLILDLKASAENGDLVIATISDPITSNGATVIRRWVSGWLISSQDVATINNVEDVNPSAAVVGVIIGSIRGTDTD